MSITDSIRAKPYLEVAYGILSIQKCAIEMASFGARKRLDIWIEPVDNFTLDYLDKIAQALQVSQSEFLNTNI